MDQTQLNKLPIKDVFQIGKNLPPNKKLIEAVKIENRYKLVKNELNNWVEKLSLNTPHIIGMNEFLSLKEELFSENESIDILEDRIKNIEFLFISARHKEMDSIPPLTYEIVLSKENSDYSHEMSTYLKSVLIKELSLKYFSRKISGVVSQVVDQVELDKKNTGFLYFSTNFVPTMKMSKMNEVVNNQGRVYKIKEIFQTNDIFTLNYKTDIRKFKVKIPVYYGILICGDK